MVLKKNKIIFRADGSTITGYGHVMRLLSLARILKKKYHLEFIVQQPDAFLKKQITTVCNTIKEIPITSDYRKEANQLQRMIQANDIVIIDGYNFDTPYQTAIKKKCFN
jgi:spore coat polysaccharide biosynthesis predicted glycosyltransferase SpsG